MKKLAQNAFICLITFIPFSSVFELISLFTDTVTSLAIPGAPVWWKLVKDVLALVVIFASALSQTSGWRMKWMAWASLFIMTFFVVMSIASSAGLVPLWSIPAGLRWLLPVAFTFFLPAIMEDALFFRILRLLEAFFYVHVSLQIIQLFSMSKFYGTQLGGLAARTPGLFLAPNTAAFYSTISLFIFLFFNDRVRLWPVLLSLASVALAQSGTGMVVCSVLLFLWVLPKHYMALSPWVMSFGSGLLFAGFALVSPSLGRGRDYLAVSGGTRISIFIDALAKSGFWGSSFGRGTNSGMLLGVVDTATDSIYASVVINLGWGAFAGLVFALVIAVFKSKRNKRTLGFLVVYGLFGATTIFFEAFPMNYLFSLFVVFFSMYPQKAVGDSAHLEPVCHCVQ